MPATSVPLETTSSHGTLVSGEPTRPTMSAEEARQYTLKKRPWRLRQTPFEELVGEKYPGRGTEEEPYIVTWLANDPENPQTFAQPYKWTISVFVSIATLAVALASSGPSGAAESVIATFGVSQEVFTLSISLFVLGFALGPLLWAPASEVYGRRNTFLVSYVFFTLWNSVAAASPNIGAYIVFRFLAGSFGSSPLTNAGGTLSDVFDAKQRGLGMAIFASAPFLGPALGPIIGGFLGETAGFRWVQGLLGIFAGVITVIGFTILPETYAPTLLRRRADLLSKATGKVYRASVDAKGKVHIPTLMKTSLGRPWKLLFLEPIVLIISLYMSVVYGTLYMLFGAFPIVFQQQRGWSPGVGGLAFLGILVGMLVGVAYIIAYENNRYIRVADSLGGRAPPEARLPAGIIGSFLLVIGLGWFAGTCGPNIHWIVPIIASAPFGCGMVLVFLSLMNYLVDSYVIYAASALAANSVLRSIFGAVFPLFTSYMYAGLGVNWASSIPAFLGLACLPFPILFYKYGHIVREKSKFAVEAARILEEMMGGAAKKSAEKAPEEKPKDLEAGGKSQQ